MGSIVKRKTKERDGSLALSVSEKAGLALTQKMWLSRNMGFKTRIFSGIGTRSAPFIYPWRRSSASNTVDLEDHPNIQTKFRDGALLYCCCRFTGEALSFHVVYANCAPTCWNPDPSLGNQPRVSEVCLPEPTGDQPPLTTCSAATPTRILDLECVRKPSWIQGTT